MSWQSCWGQRGDGQGSQSPWAAGSEVWPAETATDSSWLSSDGGDQGTPGCQTGPGPCSSVGMLGRGITHHLHCKWKSVQVLWAQSELVSKGWCTRGDRQPTQSLLGVWCWMQLWAVPVPAKELLYNAIKECFMSCSTDCKGFVRR